MGTSFALAALLVHTTKAMIWLARQMAVLTIVMAVMGMWRHFDENYNTAPVDSRYTERGETMSTGTRLWSVTNGSVGQVPIPASGELAPNGLALGMATIGLGGHSDGSPKQSKTAEP